MEILAMYDIADPKRLRRIEKTMKYFGVRVQKSVFECSLKDSLISEMKYAIKQIMNIDEDSFRIYPLLAQSRDKQTIIGKGEIPPFPPHFII
jgi:CRISPR-associated protein Cas2